MTYPFGPYSYDGSAALSAADPDALLWQAAVVGAGGTVSSARLSVVSTLISTLKANSLWTLLDRLWLLAAENATSALIDVKGLATATATNSPTFTANQGYTGNGTTSFLNTGYVPTTDAVQFAQNSGHVSTYCRTNRTTSTKSSMGSVDGSSIILIRSSPPTAVEVFLNASSAASGPIATAQGYIIGSRTASGTTGVDIFRNGTSIKSVNGGASVAIGSRALYVLGYDNGGSLAGATADQIAIVTIGAGLDATQAANLSTSINAYMTALGTNVY